jgi:hypothetical protein
MKKFIVAAVFAVTLSSAAHAAATVTNECPAGEFSLIGKSCDFYFWDAQGTQVQFNAAAYHDTISASGNETQVIKGFGLQPGDAPVVYSANSGDPVPAGQTCWSFTTGKTTANWQMIIEADGTWTLTCNFKK